MVKVSILYANKPGTHFDVDYYLNTHMPMAVRVLGPAIKAVSVEIGIGGMVPGQSAPYCAIVGFTCDSVEAFAEAFLPHATALQGDIPNYTDAETVIQVSQLSAIGVAS